MTYSFVGKFIPGYDFAMDILNTWLGGSRGWLVFAFPLILVGRAMVKIERKINWKIMAALSMAFMIGLLAEALVLRKVAGHTGIDSTIMMIPTTFCILGFLISVKFPQGQYSVFFRNMSVLIFMTQRLFLTVLPKSIPQSVNDLIFDNRYVGALIICGSTVIFSAGIVFISKKIKFLKLLY